MQYQTDAVKSVIDCFSGQPKSSAYKYKMDPGRLKEGQAITETTGVSGYGNTPITIETKKRLLDKIKSIQQHQMIPVSNELIETKYSNINLDIEMETGTGKTYCYIKTIYELNQHFGWKKFIIMVPSIAIREGIYESFKLTKDHFSLQYRESARFFIYDSTNLQDINLFASDNNIQVIIMNIQAFNSGGQANRRIYAELDSFQSRRPIDVIKRTRPILILDEPQKMTGPQTSKSMKEFDALFALHYSATHRENHNKIYRLDALDAYNQKLVKKISVRGISVKGLSGTTGYLYLEQIKISTSAPVAYLEIEQKQASTIKRQSIKVSTGDNLYVRSNDLTQYKGYIVDEINYNTQSVTFTNGISIECGELQGSISDQLKRRIQIRETIKAHLEKEQENFKLGIKTLSLFFIDEVAKYRQYKDGEAKKGEYAEIFEEEYENAVSSLGIVFVPAYREYLNRIEANSTHNGYFSIDKKTKQLVDPKDISDGESKDIDAYDLILKDKKKLLSFEEPTRFIFSHSALREGWDNPNIFSICTLKHSDNIISRRQEVGRGLRISVNHKGDRQDDEMLVHQINQLTVVTDESYTDFVSALQTEISNSLSARSHKANKAYFEGKYIKKGDEIIEINSETARAIEKYLIKNDYIDSKDGIAETYTNAKKENNLAELPEELNPYSESIFKLIDSVYDPNVNLDIVDGRKDKTNKLNTNNFNKKEFQELWNSINSKSVYRVDFDSQELIEESIKSLNENLRVDKLYYRVERGDQREHITADDLKQQDSFEVHDSQQQYETTNVHSVVKYDLIGEIAKQTELTRKAIADILIGIEKPCFGEFKRNPEQFIMQASKLINEQKATTIINRLTYNILDDKYSNDIFTKNQTSMNSKYVHWNSKKHVYQHVPLDSIEEKKFVNSLESGNEVLVYSKLPRGFKIPTPVGNYSPDWAIVFKKENIKHIYFVAETKGNMSTMNLRKIEETKIISAKKFFAKLEIEQDIQVKYDVVDNYDNLLKIVCKK